MQFSSSVSGADREEKKSKPNLRVEFHIRLFQSEGVGKNKKSKQKYRQRLNSLSDVDESSDEEWVEVEFLGGVDEEDNSISLSQFSHSVQDANIPDTEAVEKFLQDNDIQLTADPHAGDNTKIRKIDSFDVKRLKTDQTEQFIADFSTAQEYCLAYSPYELPDPNPNLQVVRQKLKPKKKKSSQSLLIPSTIPATRYVTILCFSR